MGSSVLYMSMSLDGFVTGPDDGPDNGLGVGGERLHAWLGEWTGRPTGFDPPGASGVVFRELMATGAVVVGRKTFDYAGHSKRPASSTFTTAWFDPTAATSRRNDEQVSV